MKLWWSVLIVAIILPMIISATIAENDLWEEDDKEVLVRSVRGTKGRASGGNGGSTSPSCRYAKGEWSECDSKTNTRTRMMTLKKGESSCEKTKTMTKKCKKACRYEKGSWSSCVDQLMARVDNLKANSSPSCEKTRRMSKRCKPDTTNTKKTTKALRAKRHDVYRRGVKTTQLILKRLILNKQIDPTRSPTRNSKRRSRH